MRSALVIVLLLSAFGFMGTMDYADALVTDAIRKDPPKILAYTIQQDGPAPSVIGYTADRVVLTCPVETGCKQVKSKKRRKDNR